MGLIIHILWNEPNTGSRENTFSSCHQVAESRVLIVDGFSHSSMSAGVGLLGGLLTLPS